MIFHLWKVIKGQCIYNEKIVQEADKIRFLEGLAEALPQLCIQLGFVIGGLISTFPSNKETKLVYPLGWGKSFYTGHIF